MNDLSGLLGRVGERKDILLVVLLLAVVFMMVLPLPPLLLDILIAVNITISVVLLMMSVYIGSPLQFSVFPAVLLITTLFRLALSVSTTRMILLQADAGQIVNTFGSFVVGGNLVVGIIIFLIITIVQFLVITKGAERVAEVSARFSLDAMPGKQMSIDGDMRAGVIDVNEARARRAAISLWPTCTPSAPAASATSTLSSTTKGTCRAWHNLARARASSSRAAGESSFSRSCTKVAPPSSAAATVSSRVRPRRRRLSVTAYKRSCCGKTFIMDSPCVQCIFTIRRAGPKSKPLTNFL